MEIIVGSFEGQPIYLETEHWIPIIEYVEENK
jgi:hypothetical protein